MRSRSSSIRRSAAIALAVVSIVGGSLAGIPAFAGPPEDAWHLDDGFGTEGEVVTSFGAGFDEIFDVALQTDGKIVAVGEASVGAGGSDFAVARYTTDGKLDPAFGTGGLVTTDFDGRNDSAQAVAIYRADDVNGGKIVVVGSAGNAAQGGRPDIGLVRYLPNGALDPTFNGSGKKRTDMGALSGGNAVAIYPPGTGFEGRIVVAGTVSTLSGKDFVVARYLGNGALDTSFINGGAVTQHVGDSQYDDVHGVAIDAGGKITVVGSGDSISDGAMELQLNPDGSVNMGFGGENTGIHREGSSNFIGGWAVAIQQDGKILVAGQRSAAFLDMGVVRLTQDGHPDTTFGESHVAYTGFEDSSFHHWRSVARDVLVQPDGKIVTVGWAAQSGDGSSTTDLVYFALARFNADGKPDKTFGDDTVTPGYGNGIVAGFAFGYDAALAAALQRNDDIVAAGGSNQAPPGQTDIDFALARFTGPGSAGPSDFKATVHPLPNFELRASPETFPVAWSAVNIPGSKVTFDVRTRRSRWHEKSFEAWRIILTKSPKTKTQSEIIRGTTLCVEVRANAEETSQTSAWSSPECTATPVDDRTLSATGHWNRGPAPDYYAGTFSGAGRKGVELHLDDAWFGHLAVLIGKCPTCGRFEVLIDDKVVAHVDTHASKDLGGVLVNIPVPGNGVERHDVRLRVTDPGKRGVYIDALGVLRA